MKKQPKGEKEGNRGEKTTFEIDVIYQCLLKLSEMRVNSYKYQRGDCGVYCKNTMLAQSLIFFILVSSVVEFSFSFDRMMKVFFWVSSSFVQRSSFILILKLLASSFKLSIYMYST